jgi:hypothetical protein
MTIHQSHAAGLLAGLRDGRMTTHCNPVFTVKVLLEPPRTVANCAVTQFCAVPILFNWVLYQHSCYQPQGSPAKVQPSHSDQSGLTFSHSSQRWENQFIDELQ